MRPPLEIDADTAGEDVPLLEGIRTTRAIRRLLSDPIPAKLIRKVCEAGTFAPSGGNRQPWIFVAVTDADRRAFIAERYRRAFAAYNGLVGYLVVHREDPAWRGLVLYTSAMALHFVVNDFSLREHHKKAYSHTARWLLAAAAFAGWALGIATEISGLALGVLAGFLAGGVIMNVLKEELPAERESRFWAFAAGAAGYAALLLVV